jgi:integrase
MSYFYQKEGNKWSIRFHSKVNGKKKQPRYPYKLYKHLESEEEIKALVTRLNHTEDEKAKEAIEIKTSFIPVRTLEEFRAKLLAEIPNEKDARYLYRLLHSRVLFFFVNELKKPDPSTWHQYQSQYGVWLLQVGLSPKSLKHITQLANRFLTFLNHTKIKPISRSRFKELQATRDLSPQYKGRFIKDADWKKILKDAGNLSPVLKLMYAYGLRRAEALALKPEDVRHGYLNVERQMKTVGKYSPTKGRQTRKVPHWFSTPEEAHTLITQAWECKVHPDTLGVRFDELGLGYKLHDIRRTFITRALEKQIPLAVQLAVGHTSLSTTMKYVRDNREFEDVVWKPAG